jgi:hypothetical protein
VPTEEGRVVQRQNDGKEDQEGQRIEDHCGRLMEPLAEAFMYSAPEAVRATC